MRQIQQLMRSQDGLISRTQVFALGFNDNLIHSRLQSMAWVAILPGVYLEAKGAATVKQQARAAWMSCGPRSMVTGTTAMRLHGVRLNNPDSQVSVLIPHAARLRQSSLVRPMRTTVLPNPVTFDGIPLAPLDRATIDACDGVASLEEMRARIAAAVQQKRCSPAVLNDTAQMLGRRSRLLNEALDEIADGVRSVPEGFARRLILDSDLPAPLWNPRLYTRDGELIAIPDAYWPRAGVAVEIESKEYHFEDVSWKQTMKRRARMTSFGIMVIPCPPSRLTADGAGFLRDVGGAYQQGIKREQLDIVVRRAS